MKRVVSIVEGYGDREAVPVLLARIGSYLGVSVISPNPIRAGEWKKVRRPGELERFLELAYSRKLDHILILMDLDDDCPVTESNLSIPRIEAWKNGRLIRVSLIFLVREYEAIFLCCADDLTADSNIAAEKMAGAEIYRDAKGHVKSLIGRRYKETQDQLDLTKKIDVSKLIDRSRSIRKLAKDVFEDGILDRGNNL